MTEKKIQFSKTTFHLLAVLGLGLMVRLIGLDYGLPFLYNLDEAQVVITAARFGNGDLNPHTFIYPPLFQYLIFLCNALFFVLGYVFRFFESVSDYKYFYYNHPGLFYLIGRLMSAFLGVLTLLFTWLLGKKAFNHTTGLLAALFLAVMPLHFHYSRLALTDVPMGFFVLASLYFTLCYAKEGKGRQMVLSGLTAGLAMAAKYNAGLILLAILMVHLYAWFEDKQASRRQWLMRLMGHLLLAGAGFVLANPFSLLDFQSFIRDIYFNTVVSASSGAASESWFGYVRYFFLPQSWTHAGDYFGLFCLAGIVYGILKKSKTDVILMIFPFIHFLFFAVKVTSPIKPVYILPVIPVFYLFGARLISDVFSRLPLKKGLVPVIVLLFLFWPARQVAVKCYSQSRIDTVTAARQWIESNIPEGSKILYSDKHDLMLRESKASLLHHFQETGAAQDPALALAPEKLKAAETYEGPTYFIERFPQKWGNLTQEKLKRLKALPPGVQLPQTDTVSLDYWLSENVDYIVVFPKQRLKYMEESAREAHPYYYHFYHTLETHGKMIQEYKPDKIHFTGYGIEIFDMKNFNITETLLKENPVP